MRHVWRMAACLVCATVFGQPNVHNGLTGAGYKLRLEEELRFGADSDEDSLIWPSLDTRVFPGPDGQMYIFDFAANRILAFSPEGRFIKQVAAAGPGPGELQGLSCVSQAADLSFFVVDAAKNAAPVLKRYDAQMVFQEQVPLRGLGMMPAVVSVSPDGKFLAGQFTKIDPATRSIHFKTALVSLADKALVHEFLDVPMPLPDPKRMQDPSMWEEYLAKQFKSLYHFGVVAFDPKGACWAGISDKYEIKRWQKGVQDKPDLIFGRDYKPFPFGEEERAETLDHFWDNLDATARQLINRPLMERAMVKADLPPGFAPLMGFIALEDKGVLVVHHVDMKTRATRGDVFDTKGNFLCQIEVADNGLAAFSTSKLSARMVFYKGKAYTILTDEQGENRAVRYRYSLSPGK